MRYLPLRYSCSVLTSSADSSFIEQIERVAAIAAFIVVKYGSLKRSTHANRLQTVANRPYANDCANFSS
nr:hypothetical protein [uncultured Campylobacter sp.]